MLQTIIVLKAISKLLHKYIWDKTFTIFQKYIRRKGLNCLFYLLFSNLHFIFNLLKSFIENDNNNKL